MITQTTEYAIRAVIYLAKLPEGESSLVRKMAEELDIPQQYLSKVLYQLTITGVLESTRGRKGGFRMRRDPAKVRLRDIVAAFENPDAAEQCILGQRRCNDAHACPLHHFWKSVKDHWKLEMETKTLAELAEFSRQDETASLPTKSKKSAKKKIAKKKAKKKRAKTSG